MRILVAEDDVRPAALLAESLTEAGWQVEVVHDGAAASATTTCPSRSTSARSGTARPTCAATSSTSTWPRSAPVPGPHGPDHRGRPRPASLTSAAKPSSPPGQCARSPSSPAARATDLSVSITTTASSAYPMTGMKSGTRSIGSAR